MNPLEAWPEMVDHDDPELSECSECGAEGYRSPLTSAHECRECWTENVRELLDYSEDTSISRLDALDRLDRHDSFPVADPSEDDRLILSAEIGRAPQRYLKKIVHIIPGECPRCGYDRAEERYESMFSEFAEKTTCRACGFVIDSRSSL